MSPKSCLTVKVKRGMGSNHRPPGHEPGELAPAAPPRRHYIYHYILYILHSSVYSESGL